MQTYRALRPDKIIETSHSLKARIDARFPNSGLGNVAGELESIAKKTSESIEHVSHPHWALRALLIATIVLFVLLLAYFTKIAINLKGSDELSEVLQGLDAMFNLTVLCGGAAFFFSTLEVRLKRSRALAALHELRSIVHVIDMHQLNKDPSSDRQATVSAGNGIQRPMSAFELTRYLDYCSELLSLTAKCAALYAARLSDGVIIDTVGDVERLTSDLSTKIWQKITMIQSREGRDFPLPRNAPTSQSVG